MRAARVAAMIAAVVVMVVTEPSLPRRRPTMSRPRSARARSTAPATTSRIPTGARSASRTCASRRPPTPTASGARRRAADALRQQPHLRRLHPEPVLRERRHAVGLRLGPVHGPHDRAARGGRRRARADRVRRARPDGGLHQRFRRDRLLAHARRPGHRHRRRPARAAQHGLEPDRRLEPLRRHRPAPGVAARGTGQRRPRRQRREAAARRRPAAAPLQPRQRRRRARDGAPGRARRDAAEGDGRRRRAREREHRADRHAHAVRARAQPDRRRAPRHACGGAEVPDRAPDHQRRAAVHHLHRVPPVARRAAARVPRLRRDRQPDARATSSRSSATGRTA